MRCSACGKEIDLSAELPGSEVRCACGAFVDVPERPAKAARVGPGAALRCPRCGHALAAETQGGITLHGCAKCAGIFVDRSAVEELGRGMRETAQALVVREDPEPASPVADTSRYVRCPICQAMMNPKNFGHRSGVIIDVCAGHGAWFDADELGRTARFVLEGGLDAGPRPPKESPDAARRRAEVLKTAGEVQALGVADGFREARRTGRNAWFAGSIVGLIVEWMSS
jgi:Zn-finger nucleic acid-binding protein